MDGVKEFLESSTIHGLVYISTTRRLIRLLWISVVNTGFIVASYLIPLSFSSWATSPVSTTIDTRPITDLHFPNVTVCPPRNTFTSLNPDLVRARTLKFDEQKRKELSDFVADVVFDTNYKQRYSAFAAYEEKENWYTGMTKIGLPAIDVNHILTESIQIQNLTGTFSTAFFRKPFNESRFESLSTTSVHLEFPTYFDVNKGSRIGLAFEYDIDETYNDESIEVAVNLFDIYNDGSVVVYPLTKLDITKKTFYMVYPSPEDYIK